MDIMDIDEMLTDDEEEGYEWLVTWCFKEEKDGQRQKEKRKEAKEEGAKGTSD